MRVVKDVADFVGDQKGKYDEYGKLSLKIRDFNDIQAELKIGWEILKAVKAKGNKEMYTRFEKEYKDLYSTIKTSFESEKTFSKEEREKIKKELVDIVVMADSEGIQEEKSWASKVGDIFRGNNTEGEKKQALSIKSKPLKDNWTTDEVLHGLMLTRGLYAKAGSNSLASSLANKFANNTPIANSVEELGENPSKRDLNLFQEKIIEKALGVGHKGFNTQGYIMAFYGGIDGKGGYGNYLTTAPEVEKVINTVDFERLGTKALKNYLGYLDNSGKFDKDTLVAKFGVEKTQKLIGFFERNNSDPEIQGSGLMAKLINIKNSIAKAAERVWKSAQEFLSSISQSKTPQEFEKNLKMIEEIKPEEKSKVLDELKKEIDKKDSALRNMFLQPLLKKGVKEKEAQKIVTELIQQIEGNLTVDKLGNVFKIVSEFNKKYDASLDEKGVATTALENKTLKATEQLIRKKAEAADAKKKGDKKTEAQIQKEIDKAVKSIAILSGSVIVLNNTSQSEAKAIGQEKLDYKKFLEEKASKDPELRGVIEYARKVEKDYYITYPEEKTKQTKNEAKTDETSSLKLHTELPDTHASFAYETGTKVSYTAVSGGYSVTANNETIEMSYKEFQTIKSSEKALENMLHFKDTLDELNLGGLWKYRDKIFQSLANKYALAFNTRDDYLNQSELKIFLTSVLKSVGSPSTGVNNFEDLKNEIKTINYAGAVLGQKDVNISGDSLIESLFIAKFDPDRNGNFKQNAFSESLSEVFGKQM